MMRLQAAVFALLCAAKAAEAAYNLPAGVKEQTGLAEIKENFKCEMEGYFADIDNECKIYHQCNSFNSKGSGKFGHSTMACGSGQIFDQSKLACKAEDDAIPCDASPDFYYLNERIGDAKADFLTDADIDKAAKARPKFRAAAAAKKKKKKRRKKKKKKKKKKKRSLDFEDLLLAAQARFGH